MLELLVIVQSRLTGGRLSGILLRDLYSKEAGSLSALRMGLCWGLLAGECWELALACSTGMPGGRCEGWNGASEVLANSEEACAKHRSEPGSLVRTVDPMNLAWLCNFANDFLDAGPCHRDSEEEARQMPMEAGHLPPEAHRLTAALNSSFNGFMRH